MKVARMEEMEGNLDKLRMKLNKKKTRIPEKW